MIKHLSAVFAILFLSYSCEHEKLNIQYTSQLIGNIQVNSSSGFYNQVPLLKFSTDKEGELFYTLNGNEVLPGSAYTYSCSDSIDVRQLKPQQLFKNRTSVDRKGTSDSWEAISQLPVQGVSFKIGRVVNGFIQETAVFNYVFGEDLRKNMLVETVMLTTSSAGLMSNDSGLFAIGDTTEGYQLGKENFYKRGRDWERKCEFQYFDSTGVLKYRNTIGLAVFGNVSRYFPQKSMRITARKKLGEKDFNFNFFDDDRIHSKRMIMRTAHCGWKNGIYKDCLLSEICRGLSFETAKQKPVVVFINGEYWGIYFLGEKIDREFIQARAGLKKKEISIVRDNGKADHGDANPFKEIHNFGFSNDLKIQENYDHFCSTVDMNSYIDWLIVEIYFQNSDWPCNNTKMWKGGDNSKWRNILIDMDGSIASPNFNYINRLSHFEKGNHVEFDNRCSFIFNNLMRNSGFRKVFSERYHRLVEQDFSAEKLQPLLDKYERLMALEMMVPWQSQRWSHPTESDFEDFEDHLQDWIQERPAIALENLDQFIEKMEEQENSTFKPCSFQFKIKQVTSPKPQH